MAKRKERQYTDLGPFVSPKILVYHDQPPKLSFWGLFRIFCTDAVYSPAIIAGFEHDNTGTRRFFLQQIFGKTSVDLQNSVFAPKETSKVLNSKTEENRLSEVWHLTWKNKTTPKIFAQAMSFFRSDPKLALDGVKRNILTAIDKGQINRETAGNTAAYLLKILFPECLSGPEQPDTERSLSLLLLLCLLGEDVVLRKDVLPQAREWLDRTAERPAILLVQRFHSEGLYHIEDAQINTKLLPSIMCEGEEYKYDENGGSPLRQIILKQHCRWIFLSGQSNETGNSAVSGAGKTTSLRYLASNERDIYALWLPLAEIYEHHNAKDKDVLKHHIKMKFGLDLETLPDETLLLFDGLDELVAREQLEQLSGDLDTLQRKYEFGLIVSSKLPWEDLPQVDIFYQWGSVWEEFSTCILQNLSKKQIEDAVPEYTEEEPLDSLNTPFLLSLYLHTASLPDDPWTLKLIERWHAEDLFHDRTLGKELLFYRSLLIQIIRWHENARGREIQWEMDVFLLLHAMPAIAYQMLRSESNDSALDPASAVDVDQEYIKQIIDIALEATYPGLYLFPGYTDGNVRRRAECLLRGLGFEKFLSGAVPSLFHGEWDGKNQYAQPRFTNQSLRDNLAFLHIANLFLLAYHGALETTPETIQVYGHTVEFIPAAQLQQAAAYFDLLSPDEGIRNLLRRGPNLEIKSPLSRFLAGHIGATMCERITSFQRDQSISSDPWYTAEMSGFEELNQSSDHNIQELIWKRFGLAYIFGQIDYSRKLRNRGEYHLAKECAERVLQFQLKYPNLINSDGYHMRALVLLDQIRLILNGTYNRSPEPVCDSELAFAVRLTDELDRLTKNPHTPKQLLSNLSEGQARTVPVFSMMLHRAKMKLEIYAEREFFHNADLKFLCTASYAAKANCVFAALSPGHSGMACNLLGSMAANDDEVLGNNKFLPFFRENPKQHLDIPGLAYENRFDAAFQIFLLIYNIRRGPQPYSARRLCELMLRHQVRLDQNNQPVSGMKETPFSEVELSFLKRAMAHAMMKPGNSELYWNTRYLHELALQSKDQVDADANRSNAEHALRSAWKSCGCDKIRQQLETLHFDQVDFVSFLVIVENLLMNPPKGKETRDFLYDRIFCYLDYYRSKCETHPKYTTGAYIQDSDIHDCVARIKRLRLDSDSFIENHYEKVFKFQ